MKYRPIFAPFSIAPPSSASIVASAAAQETGLPPKVPPCAPATHLSMISLRPTTADSGRPLAMPLAQDIMSGLTPCVCHANILPVRPKPVCTSSKISMIPYLSQISRTYCNPFARRYNVTALALYGFHQDGRDRIRIDQTLENIVKLGEIRLGARAVPRSGTGCRTAWDTRQNRWKAPAPHSACGSPRWRRSARCTAASARETSL